MANPRNAIGVVGNDGNGNAVPVTGTQDTRFGLASFLRRINPGPQAMSGVLRSYLQTFTPSGSSSDFSYNIGPGTAVIGYDSAGGAYVVPAPDAVNVPNALGAPASGLTRYDAIYLVQNDAFDRSAGATGAQYVLVNGTATSGTPSVPAGPDNSLLIMTNLMTSAATSTASSGNTIAPAFPFTTANGGVLYFRTAAEESAASVMTGEVYYRRDLDVLLYKSAAAPDVQVARQTDLTTRTATYGSVSYGTSAPGTAQIQGGASGTIASWTHTFPVTGKYRLTWYATITAAGSGVGAGSSQFYLDGAAAGPGRRLTLTSNSGQTSIELDIEIIITAGSHSFKVNHSAESASNALSFTNQAMCCYAD